MNKSQIASQRQMAANLSNGQFMATRATLALLLEKKSLEDVLGSEPPRAAATFFAVNKASHLFMKNKLGLDKVQRITVWEEAGKISCFEIIAGAGMLWKFPVPSFKTFVPMVVKPMPVATPKRVDGTPAVVVTRETLLAPTSKVSEVVANHPVPVKVVCGKCANNATYDAKVLDANGTEGIKQMKVCKGCHDVMAADPSLAIEAVALS
jgi:hypothetical protein